jgi:putative heme-binding domain-containing protein
LALSLGESDRPGSIQQLAKLARGRGDIRWMDTAIASSVGGREAQLLEELLAIPGESAGLSELLVATIASRGDEPQIRRTLEVVGNSVVSSERTLFTRILETGLAESRLALERIAVDPPPAPGPEILAAREKRLPDYLAALEEAPDIARGRKLFIEHCASCHVARGLGTTMGPNLDAEHQRAPETIVRDILFPHEAISAGFEAVQLEMRRGADVFGVLASESPTSVTLRFPAGAEFTFLRKRIDRLRVHKTSLMPAAFGELLAPDELCDLVGFLRQP